MDKSKTYPIVYLSGGLGNQLFQLASGLRLNSKRLIVNISQIRGRFELYEFLNHLAHKRGIQIDVETSNPTRFFIAVHNYILRSTQWKKSVYLKKLPTDFASLVMRLRSPSGLNKFVTDYSRIGNSQGRVENKAQIHLVGYFQNQDVANEIANELAAYLDSISLETDKKNSKQDSIAIVHVRRGDYSSEEKIGMLSLSYFRKAIGNVAYVHKNLDFKLFSNGDVDLEDLATSLRIQGITLVDSDSALDLLNRMRNGRIFIISNSTLSWWAAYLCANQNKLVLYPDPWFRNLPRPVNLYPETWEAFPAIWIEENEG
jgi:hypothetical protein